MEFKKKKTLDFNFLFDRNFYVLFNIRKWQNRKKKNKLGSWVNQSPLTFFILIKSPLLDVILVKGKIKLNTFTKFGDEIDKVGSWAIKMTTISILESKIWSLVPFKKKKKIISFGLKSKTHDLFLVNIIEIRSINLYTFFFFLG